jgi:hypothetical protein
MPVQVLALRLVRLLCMVEAVGALGPSVIGVDV